MRDFIENTVKNIDIHISITENFNHYKEFNSSLRENKEKLLNVYNQLAEITPYKLNLKKQEVLAI